MIDQVIDLLGFVQRREVLSEDALCEDRKLGDVLRILDPDEV